jgi:aminomethyltransferase
MSAGLRRTPLWSEHRALGAKLVPFAGWEMPVSYRGILDEHRAVRSAAGLFDVSHMGEIELSGPDAADICQALTTNDVRRLAVGRVQYTLLCGPEGGVVDDTTLYRTAETRYFFCVNAANIEKDLVWIRTRAAGVAVRDRSAETALVALQGPRSAAILGRLTTAALAEIGPFGCVETEVARVAVLVSRTGYTGEDGFELFARAEHAAALWAALMETGRAEGLAPAGLGARDTLRLEAALPLYGNELDDTTTPLEAGLERFVKLDGEDFVGRAALVRERERGSHERLVGLELVDPGIARHGYPVLGGGEVVGRVTSGGHSPALGRSIALAYVGAAHAAPGTALAVEVRGRALGARVVSTPFYRRAMGNAVHGKTSSVAGA